MPLFLDVHNMPGATLNNINEAHRQILAKQDAYGVHYLHYWFDEAKGKCFCLIDAPSAEAATEVHRVANGVVSDEIYEVQQDS